MTPEEFRVAGHRLIDWIADHRASVEERRVRADVSPGEIRSAFPVEVPVDRADIDTMLDELRRLVLPGVTEVQHPMHFGWFPANATMSSVLGDIASSGLATLGISWESCPSLTEVEEVMAGWLGRLCGLSDRWRGSIHDTASTAVLVSLLVARERATGLVQNTGGMQALDAPLVVYSTAHAHSSVAKAALLAGYGWDNIRVVETDPHTYAMDPASLRAALAEDHAAGRRPAAIVLTLGTTGVTSFDPIPEILDEVAASDVWVHVDAAMAGAAMLLPEMRHLFEGIEGADAISWNPHKWMGTILDCSLLYMRDADLLQRVMATNPSYLRSPDDGEATQLRDWGIPLGRRFRALKLWFQLRMDGVEEIQDRLRRDLENAAWLARQVEAEPDWEVVAPVPLQTVCVRHRPVGPGGVRRAGAELDRHTLRWVQEINTSGEAFLTPSILDGEWMVRVSIGVLGTERRHVERVWELMREAAGRVGEP
jgi:aromatic-L-amino-acid decarboxylase